MIKLMYESNPLNEMAIINPKMCKQLSIQVEIEQRNEGPIPHVHVYLDKTRNPKNCSYVRLDKCEYSTYHKDSKKMTRNQKEQFIELMNAICPNVAMTDNNGNMRPATGYQAACLTWSETYENGNLNKFNTDDNGFITQLDYSNL